MWYIHTYIILYVCYYYVYTPLVAKKMKNIITKKESHNKYIIIHMHNIICSIAYVKYVIIMMYHNNILRYCTYIHTIIIYNIRLVVYYYIRL